MDNYLYFRMVCPMSSWGEVSFEMDRPTLNFPIKSAIIGMIGASLGINRDNDSALIELHNKLSIIIGYEDMLDEKNDPSNMVDFFRIDSFQKKAKITKKNNLSYWETLQFTKETNLITSSSKIGKKEYLTDCIFYIWIKGESDILEKIKNGLLHPHYTLSGGRKNCIFSFPLEPQLIQSYNFHTAFEKTVFKFILKDREQIKPKFMVFENEKDIEGINSSVSYKINLRVDLKNTNARSFGLKEYSVVYIKD